MKPSHWLLLAGGTIAAYIVWDSSTAIVWDNSTAGAEPASCLPAEGYEEAAWQRIHDGDTLVLADGRRVRVLGLNAPELSGADGPEPLAVEATEEAKAFFTDAPTLLLQTGADPKDRHGRTLAHVFRKKDGANLAQQLISHGLAWQVAVPPNLDHLDCFLAAEAQARNSSLGIWAADPRAAFPDGRPGQGFRVLQTRIQAVSLGANWWLETGDGFVIRISAADQRWFDPEQVESWRGAAVEVRGWMYGRQGSAAVARGHAPWVLSLRHPSGLQQVSTD